jgi:FkbM family methyltransferase
MSSKPEELVKAIYNLLLDRNPEPAGLKHWSGVLQNGLSKKDFLRAVLSSSEFQEKMGSADFSKYQGVDLIIPVHNHQLRVPAADLSLVPHLLQHRSWEPHLTRYLTLNLSSADVFMDVGANLGYYTVICAPLVHRVVAFEPASISHSYCKANIDLNNLRNVDLLQYGLWHEEATANIRFDRSSMMAASISLNEVTSNAESIRCVSLDDLIRRRDLALSRLDVVKMDIEGAELSALRGMQETIAQFRPKIIMELNRPALEYFGKTTNNIWDFFCNISYKIQAFEQWQETDPRPVKTIEELNLLCPPDSLIDIVAVP